MDKIDYDDIQRLEESLQTRWAEGRSKPDEHVSCLLCCAHPDTECMNCAIKIYTGVDKNCIATPWYSKYSPRATPIEDKKTYEAMQDFLQEVIDWLESGADPTIEKIFENPDYYHKLCIGDHITTYGCNICPVYDACINQEELPPIDILAVIQQRIIEDE